MNEIKLKPCPFCGRMPKVRHGAAIMERAFDMAADAWNRRAEHD